MGNKMDKDKCKARLIYRAVILWFGAITQSEASLVDITPEMHTNKFIEDKSGQLEIYPNKIDQELIISLRNKFEDIPYGLSTKKTVYDKIREKSRG
ncbi:hypothetical protein HZS_445 [Henneguya salminicola]|nr:hypothetical protein HZS_445 [Henneguya salminicola]